MYYPLSEITPDLYTDGSEFIYQDSGAFYKGYYFSTTDGRFYTERTLLPSSKEIVRGTIVEKKDTTSPEQHIPDPSTSDYELGYITRYVSKRVNSGIDTMREISKEEYDRIRPNPLYNKVEFKWQIVGRISDDYSNSNIPIYGLIHINKKTVSSLEPSMPGISNFFKDYSEFAKEP
jgi:hypothetical protein